MYFYTLNQLLHTLGDIQHRALGEQKKREFCYTISLPSPPLKNMSTTMKENLEILKNVTGLLIFITSQHEMKTSKG